MKLKIKNVKINYHRKNMFNYRKINENNKRKWKYHIDSIVILKYYSIYIYIYIYL